MDSRDLARALRDAPPELDDIRRARIERNLLEEAAVGHAVRAERPGRRGLAVGVVGAFAVAAVALLAWAPWRTEAPASQLVRFEALRDGVPVRTGTFAEGESLQTAADQLLRVRFGGTVEGEPNTLVELEPSTRVHFATVLGDARELELERGHVRVEFHPHRRGEETLAIRTPSARIEVVGTIFEVEVDELRGTRVSVSEGAVRVIPLGEGHGETSIVRAGESRSVGHVERAAAQEQSELAARSYPEDEDEPSAREPAARAPIDPAELDDAEDAEDAEQVDALEHGQESAPELSVDARFDLAARYLEQGRYAAARHELRAIARSNGPRISRARAWTEIAQIYEAEREPGQAAEAYRRAANVGRGTTIGTNALFALGRMRASLSDAEAAKVAYRRYLDEAPDGPLARQARRALCRLGDSAQCSE